MRTRYFLFALICSIVIVSFGDCLFSEAFGDEIEASLAREDVASENQGSAQDAAAIQDNLLENSWRFDQGNLIEGTEPDIQLFAQRDVAYSARGIDISEHQGFINWDRVKQSGVQFAIIRIGFAGYDFGGRADYYWKRNVSECERLNIPYGVYLYSYADSIWKASNEASMALNLLQGHHPALPVYYDLEDDSIDKSNVAAIASAFCGQIQGAGYRVGIYANLYWWNSFLTDSCFDNWDKWVAQYNYQCDYDGSYSLWQHTSKASIDGIDGFVDENYWNGVFPYGWVDKDGKRYYYAPDGAMAHGEALIGGSWYHFDEVTGEMTVGFADVPDGAGSSKRVYYAPDGAMAHGEALIGGSWYHFDEVTGEMTVNKCN